MSRVVCIVGMHRSGTSSLAGSLQEAGLHLGEVITAAPHNLKGNRENKRIMDLQEAVLVHSGGSWNNPPAHVTWTDVHRAERARVIESYGDAPVWGFKDPRTLLMLDFWREVIPELTFVGTFRNPRLVAESLLRRNGASLEQWFDLWTHYAERLLALHDTSRFPIVRFDVSVEAYRSSLMRVVDWLGLSPRTPLEFFDPVLRHDETANAAELPERVQARYEELCSVALAP